MSGFPSITRLDLTFQEDVSTEYTNEKWQAFNSRYTNFEKLRWAWPFQTTLLQRFTREFAAFYLPGFAIPAEMLK